MNSSTLTEPRDTAASAAPERAERLLYGDGMRICAIMGVLWIHVAAMVVDQVRAQHGAALLLCDAIIAINKWSVPVFVMLSGALLLDPSKQESFDRFYKKRISRIGVPLIVWSAFYVLWGLYHYYGNTATLKLLGKNVILSIFYAMPYYHLYFLFILLGLYLFTPLFRLVTLRTPVSTLRGYAIAALVVACGDSILRSRKGIGLNSFSLFAPFTGYFFLGFALRHTETNRGTIPRSALLVVGIAIVAAAGTFVLTGRWGSSPWSSELFDYLSPTVVPMSIAAFLLLKATFSSPGAARLLSNPAVPPLSAATFGMYLVHPFLLDLINTRVMYALSPLLLFGQMLVVFVVLMISSYLATRLIQRIPGLQILVG